MRRAWLALLWLPACSLQSSFDVYCQASGRCPTDTPTSSVGAGLERCQPRLVTPASGALRRETRPTFRWAVDAACPATGYRLEVKAGCAAAPSGPCDFDDGTALTFSGLDAHALVPEVALPTGWLRARVRVCGEQACGAWSRARAFRVGDADGDVDGDGFADVVVGSNSPSATGAVFVFFGGSALPGRTQVVSGAPQLGWSLASGDVDGDGRADVVAGAWGSEAGSTGVWLLRGGAPMLATPIPLAALDGRFGSQIAVADFTGDGLADALALRPVARELYVFPGDATRLPGPPRSVASAAAGFGASLAAMGDLLGAGQSALLVGTASDASHPGTAWLFARGTLEQPQRVDGADCGFGQTAVGAGDVDGDGFPDALLGAEGLRAVVLRGSADGLRASDVLSTVDLTAAGAVTVTQGPVPARACPSPRAGALIRLAAAGDVDADGFGDVLLAIDGAAMVLRGSAGGLVASPVGLAAPGALAGFGGSVAVPGDVNGDGLPDLVVGAPGDGAGAVVLYLSKVATPGRFEPVTLRPTGAATRFGLSVAGIPTR